MLLGRENEAIKLIASHIDKVEQCLQTAFRTVEACFADTPETTDSLVEQACLAEKEARTVQREIVGRLYRGVFMPILREDIYNIVTCMGRLARSAVALCNFLVCHRPEVPEDLKDAFNRSMQRTFEVVGPIKKGFQGYWDGYGQIEVVQGMADFIESTQMELCGMNCELNRRILTADLDPCRKLLLRDCLEGMRAILTAACNASASMERITLKTGF